MDRRLRLQHGLVADPTSHALAGASSALQDLSPYSLNLLPSHLGARQDLAQARLQANAAAAGLAPNLASGQGFYTVDSLQASAGAHRPEDLVRQSQWVGAGQQGYDALALSRLLPQQVEGSVAVGQQGLDAVGLGHLLTQQVASQRLIGSYAGSGLQGVDTETANQLIAQQLASQRLGPLLTGFSPYGQPDISLASAPVAMLAPHEAALLLRERDMEIERLKERERDLERERYRQLDRERERHRERDRREERDRERRRESDQRQRHDRRRGSERERSTDKKETDSLERRDSRGVLLIRRLPDHVETKSKHLQTLDKRAKTWCHLCQLLCTSRDMLQKHVAGKQHQLRVQAEGQAPARKKGLANSKNAKPKLVEKSSKVGKGKRARFKEDAEKKKVKDAINTKESDTTKNKSKSKGRKHRRKGKSDEIESKSEPKKTVSEDKLILTKPGEESGKVQGVLEESIPTKTGEGAEETEKFQGVLAKPTPPETGERTEETEKVEGVEEQVELKTGTPGEIEIEAMEVHSEGEDKNTHGMPALSADKKDSESDIATQGEGIETVLGKRPLEATGNHPLAKKTRKPHGKSFVAAAGAVRCEICKLTCRNAAVYEIHLTGEKHADRLKKAQAQSSTQI